MGQQADGLAPGGRPATRGPRAGRLVGTVLRCYPARWRRRHGDEAAELAALLIRDGKPAGTIALSYLAGAARERLTPRPGRRLGTALGALLIAACSLGVSVGLLASTVPARAASTSRAGERAHCAPLPRVTVQIHIPAADRPQVANTQAGESGHDRSC